MTTIVVFGGTGYAGGHIRDEALRRGHLVISVSRSDPGDLDEPDLIMKTGDIRNSALVDQVATEADVIVVAVHALQDDGTGLVAALPALMTAAADHSARLGFVGGSGTLLVREGGPRLMDSPGFPDAFKPEAMAQADVLATLRQAPSTVDWFFVSPGAEFSARDPGSPTGQFRVGDDVLLSDADGRSYISGADFATAFVDEIDHPTHHRTRFTIAY